MKKQYIQPEIELNLSEMKATFMDDAVSYSFDGQDPGHIEDPDPSDPDPDEIFSKGRRSNYSLW